MTREEAERIVAFLKERYPTAEINVTRILGGVNVEVRTNGSTMRAIIGSERSAILAVLRTTPKP